MQVTEFDFETESITEEVIRDAAEDLLEFASEVIKDTDVSFICNHLLALVSVMLME